MAVEVDLSGLCVRVQQGRQLCVTFPGGTQVCAQFGIDLGDPGAITRSFLGSLNASLAPLQPFLSLLDLVLALVAAVQAIPDAIAVPPDPTKFFSAVKALADALAKVAGIPLEIPLMVKQILVVIVEGTLVILGEIEAIIEYENDIVSAALAAAEPGNAVLQAMVDCERENLTIELENLSASMQPLNRLVGIVNLFLRTLIGQEVPTFDSIGGSAESAIVPMQATLRRIQGVLALLPG